MMKQHSIFLAVLLSALLIPTLAFAQDRGGDGGGGGGGGGGPGGDGGGRRNFDPAQMRERMLGRMREQLGASEDEWKVIQPKLEKVMAAQRDARFGGMGGMMMGGGRRGGDGGGAGGGDQQQTAVQKAASDLRTTLQSENASADEISQKLKAYREAREKAQAELAAAQKELKEVLTQKQEAQMVIFGMLD
jgi:hypothetical protein